MKNKSHPAVHPKEVSQKLNVPYKTVQAWKTKHHAELEKENEFLKKVSAYFAKESV